MGLGVIPDPREYLQALSDVFSAIFSKLKLGGILWINMGDGLQYSRELAIR